MKGIKFFALIVALFVSYPVFGQVLIWNTPVSSSAASPPGGISGRPSVSAAYYGGSVFGATTTGGTTQYLLTYINGGGSNQTFQNFDNVVIGGQNVPSNVTPALTVLGQYLYLAYTDSSGLNHVISTQDGVNWNGPSTSITLPTGTNDNPSITADPSTGTIYLAYASNSTYTPYVCSWVPGNSPTCHSFPNARTENFNPGIAFYDGLVYLGYEDRGNSHCLYFYKYTPSTASLTSWQPLQCSQQTSAGPALAVYNGYLYIAFRTNDSSKKFTVEVSTDGNTINPNNRMQPGFAVDGYPALVNVGSGLMGIYSRSGYVTATFGY